MKLNATLITELLKSAAREGRLLDINDFVRAEYGRSSTPLYVEISVNDAEAFAQIRAVVNASLVEQYHSDLREGSPPLAALFVRGRHHTPGPPLRQLIEATHGETFSSDEEWLAHWRQLVHTIHTSYQNGGS